MSNLMLNVHKWTQNRCIFILLVQKYPLECCTSALMYTPTFPQYAIQRFRNSRGYSWNGLRISGRFLYLACGYSYCWPWQSLLWLNIYSLTRLRDGWQKHERVGEKMNESEVTSQWNKHLIASFCSLSRLLFLKCHSVSHFFPTNS